jgi:hypothetical protein
VTGQTVIVKNVPDRILKLMPRWEKYINVLRNYGEK